MVVRIDRRITRIDKRIVRTNRIIRTNKRVVGINRIDLFIYSLLLDIVNSMFFIFII